MDISGVFDYDTMCCRKRLFLKMIIYPTFYKNFKCKANGCEHTCCKGWEIDVDETTALYYQTMDSDFGKRLADSLSLDEDGYHFLLDGNDRRMRIVVGYKRTAKV